MKTPQSFLVVGIFLLAGSAHANSFGSDVAMQMLPAPHATVHIGDTCTYQMKSGIITGKMVETVKAINGTKLTVSEQIQYLLFNEQCVAVTDRTSGKILSMTCNGQNQAVPDPMTQVNSQVNEQVTVPAGTFTALHTSGTDSKGDDLQNWVNETAVPITGLIKAETPSQVGPVTMELSSFSFGH